MNIEEMKKWGDCRETSLKIVQAIWQYRKTERGRQRVWETPTKREMMLIPKRAFENYEDDDELVWGGLLYREDYY